MQQVMEQVRLPKAVLLDVNGTLFPPSAAAPAFRELGLQAGDVQPWFAAVLRDAFAAQLGGVFRPFRDFGAYHLEGLLRAAGRNDVSGEDAAGAVLAAWKSAEAFSDVAPGIRALRAAGVQVAVLTNGSEAIARGVLSRAGIEGLVDPVLDIGMAQAWKPARESYQFALGQLGLAAGEVMMVAAHPWDVHGAMQAGLLGAYVQRSPHEPYPAWLPLQPHAVAPDFEALAAQLGAMGRGA